MGKLSKIKRAPSSGGSGGNYAKLLQGENKFRIVGDIEDTPPGFIVGMVGWTTNEEGQRRPVRYTTGESVPQTFEDKPKEFFAMIVWNYAEERIQILELTQAGLKDELIKLDADEDWGDLRKFDISIIRSGEGLETSYVMTPKPHKKRSDEINAAVKAMKVNLNALFTGDDPFAEEAPGAEPSGGNQPEDVPF